MPCAHETIDFDAPVDRRGTNSLKWDRYGGRDVIPLWIADMDFRSPEAVIEALHRRVQHGVFGYSLPPPELNEQIAAMLQKSYGWSIEEEWLVWLPGLVPALNAACLAVEDSAQVLTAVPIYPPFLTAPRHSKRQLITVPLVQQNDLWSWDFDQLQDAITPKTRLFLLCNPHNPVGRIYSRDELAVLADICLRHNLVICSDEIHCDLILDGHRQHVPTAALDPEIAARTITLMAPSKTFNLAGLGCSYAIIAEAELRQKFRRAIAGIVPEVNVLGFVAALAAYRHGQLWLHSLLEYLRGNRQLVSEAIAQMPGLCMTHVQATYLAWIDARPSGLRQPTLFFEKAGVGLSAGEDFGGPGFMRLNFACPRSTLTAALERMAVALARA
ncbi:MAG: PatB family C-S lyase [Deltaproteobacteria bacterium]|nr:PatB family C-S lyase [Deltaproteobacteria bacterium]